MDAPDRSRPVAASTAAHSSRPPAPPAGAAAGIEGILAAERAPALAQATKVHLLQWVDFIPEGDVEVRRQVAEYTKQTKVEVTFETINANDLQARITAAIQSGSRGRHHHDAPQLAASLRRRPGRRRDLVRVEGGRPGRLLPPLGGRGEGGQALARAAVLRPGRR